MIAALLLVAALPARTVALTRAPGEAAIVRCPVGVTTRIVFPEPVVAAIAPEMQRALGVRWEAGNTSKVVLVRPAEHPAKARLAFTGKSFGRQAIRLQTVESGEASEVRLAVEAPPPNRSTPPPMSQRPAPEGRGHPVEPSTAHASQGGGEAPKAGPAHPSAGALPDAGTVAGGVAGQAPLAPEEAAKPQPVEPERVLEEGAGEERSPGDASGRASPPPSVAPAVSAAPEASIDLSELATLTPERLDRKEGLPGQRAMTLTHLLRGPRHVFAVFSLEGGAKTRVENVSWDKGEVRSYSQSPVGSDLRIVVQLPAEANSKTRVALKLAEGGTYRFRLRSGSFTSSVKEILVGR